MSAIDEIVKLGERLKAAQEKANSVDSLEQAGREAQKRLESLRKQESDAQANVTNAHAEADKIVAQARAARNVIEAECAQACKARELDTDAKCAKREKDCRDRCEDLEAQADAHAEACRLLEEEEAKLGQSVAALRADLDAIKAKLA